MKNLLFIAFLFLMGTFKAQGNLQLNQVLLLSASANSTAQWTVPAGKAWKLESMAINSSSCYVYLNGNMAFEYVGLTGSTGVNGFVRHTQSSPLWLPAGTVFGHFSNVANAYRWFSIIEFNIVP
jgi:hypothetical protein